MKKKHALQLLIGVLISAVALYYVFKGVRLSDVFNSFKQFNYWYLLPAMAVFYSGFILRVWRWQLLFRPRYRVSFKNGSAGMWICFAFNGLFPARAGEFARGKVALCGLRGIGRGAGRCGVAAGQRQGAGEQQRGEAREDSRHGGVDERKA